MELKVCQPLLILSLFLSTFGYKNYSGYQLIRITDLNSVQLELLKSLKHKFLARDNDSSQGFTGGNGGINLLEFWRQTNTSSELFVSPTIRKSLFSSLKSMSLEPEIVMEDVGRVIQATSPANNYRKSSTHHGFDGALDDPTQFNLHDYHSYEEICEYLEAVERKHKSFVQLNSLGQSFEGRDLVYLKIGYPSERPKNALFMDAGTHSREWIAPAMALYFLSKVGINCCPSGQQIDIGGWKISI